METDFIPIDYNYFDFEGRNYAKIFGRNSKGKRICIIDSCSIYLWAILKDDLKQDKIEKLVGKINKIKLDLKGRQTKVEKVEIHNKNFLGKKVKALKIFATNYKDLHDIADKLDFPEITNRRGYDLGFVTHYIIERKINPLCWYEIEGDLLNNSLELGGIDMALDVDYCIKLKSSKQIKEKPFTPKALAYDIETNDLQIGKGEILMISLVSNNFKKVITWKKAEGKKQNWVEYVKDESELLEKFVEYVKEVSPDFLVGYYSDGFDLPYIKARADKNNVKLPLGLDGSQPKFSRGIDIRGKITGIVHVDILKFIRTAYAQYMQSETLSLNEVSKEFLGDTKKDFDAHIITKDIKWEKFYEYNLHDSVLTLKLFEKFWPDLLEFTKVIQEPIFDISRNGLSKQVESYILHNLEKFNEIPEKKPVHKEIRDRKHSKSVEGAFVYEPKPGLYNDLAIFDFTSMHTSIIISMNISKGTLLEKKENAPELRNLGTRPSLGYAERHKKFHESPELEFQGKKTKFYFSKEPGFFPSLLKEIFEKRKQYKSEYKKNPNVITKARSNAFKLLSASAHGYIGFFGARYYSLESSASILAFVRKFNKETIEKTKQAG
ncbi:MAG: ribonuclease H-like domain-containing protein, partial [Nanoarchaeota archaeon]|nr:ribonuclease H-like domain-containing protein [Nanoarchaeota archaeon]